MANRYRNIRNYYPSGVVSAETDIGRAFQKVQESTRFIADYAKVPAVAAITIAALQPTYESVVSQWKTAESAAADIFASHEDQESALLDPKLDDLREKYGDYMTRTTRTMIRELFKNADDARKPRRIPVEPRISFWAKLNRLRNWNRDEDEYFPDQTDSEELKTMERIPVAPRVGPQISQSPPNSTSEWWEQVRAKRIYDEDGPMLDSE